ncbi:MAG: hypothetical protein H5U08_00900 [Thermogutta sp.]|uniref:hypothetical protein n=1 Tax=Thermogutta sp. TaxID=1962930 RepID=UPI0019A8AA08|nr:hypothetical protein [Thermogutta sp.]MBC7350893.1 hypothetical protein [Thermogutta sp.]
MLSEFAAIVDEVVRGAEELRKALIRAEGELARTAASLKASSPLPQTSNVLNLDTLQKINAREISEALLATASTRFAKSAQGEGRIQEQATEPRSTTQDLAKTNQALSEQLQKIQPTIEQIAARLAERRHEPAGPQTQRVAQQVTQPREPTATTTVRRIQETRLRPLRSGERRYRPVRERTVSPLQRLLQTRRGRVWRWQLERSRSPLRRYVGQALSRYAERGNARRLFLELSRAPAAMRAPQAVQQAARAGMTAQQLARGAQMVGMVGRVGGMAATAAGIATGPVGIAVMAAVAIGTAFVKAAEAVWKFVRSQDEAVHEIQRFVSNFAQVHAGFAQLQAQYQVARLQEARRMAERTYGTTALAARAAERYRREGEELRALQQNLHNLWQVGKLQLAEVTKIATGIKTLEKLAGPINNAIEAFMLFLGVDTRPKPPPFQEWLDPYRRARVQMPQRQAPAAPFNRGPKK